MMLVDANVLVCAFTSSLPQHERARSWLDARLSDAVPLGLPWPSLLAVVRLTSNPRLFDRPVSLAVAWRQVEEWLGCECAWIPTPTPILPGFRPCVSRIRSPERPKPRDEDERQKGVTARKFHMPSRWG